MTPTQRFLVKPREVIVYTRPGCLFCDQVASILTEAGIHYKAIDIKLHEEQEALINRYNAISFPLVIVAGAYIGGFTHIVKLYASGKLSALVSDVPLPEAPSPSRRSPGSTPTPPSAAASPPSTPVPPLSRTSRFAVIGNIVSSKKTPAPR